MNESPRNIKSERSESRIKLFTIAKARAKMERVKEQKDFLDQIGTAFKNKQTRINDYEEFKNNFVGPHPQFP
jgi:hypothetical protein